MIRSCDKHASLPIIPLFMSSNHHDFRIPYSFQLRSGFVGLVGATSNRDLPRPAPPFFFTIKLPASSNLQAHEVNIYNTHARGKVAINRNRFAPSLRDHRHICFIGTFSPSLTSLVFHRKTTASSLRIN